MINVRVCIGTSCHLNGANNVVADFQHLIEKYDLHEKVELSAAFCMQHCSKNGVSVIADGEKYCVKAEEARKFFKETILPMVK
jgi:NADH:ubiquinone oxidoreductase subunit E